VYIRERNNIFLLSRSKGFLKCLVRNGDIRVVVEDRGGVVQSNDIIVGASTANGKERMYYLVSYSQTTYNDELISIMP
jgi:hypothetical protein